MPARRVPPVRTIGESTGDFEAWLRTHTPVVAEDLDKKHAQMRRGVVSFFRATFYRWAELVPRQCPEVVDAPTVLGVGDVHLDNYGTWRDAEGRLVWGVNDFDEATVVPYANDLVRLATAAVLCRRGGAAAMATAIVVGYRDGLHEGRAIVLEESHRRLRRLALANLGEPDDFWARLRARQRPVDVPGEVGVLLERAMPEPGLPTPPKWPPTFRRRSGLGSLGRPRYVAVRTWRGSLVARESKRLVPSAWDWAAGHEPAEHLGAPALLANPARCADPFVSIDGWWLTRRLAADCRRIDVTALTEPADVLALLRAMGRELANVHHLDPARVPEIEADLRRRPSGWLAAAAKRMAGVVTADWRAWRAVP